MSHLSPGPGDSCTWGAYTGHPNDPRGDDEGTSIREDVLDDLGDEPEKTWAEFCEFMGKQHPGFVERPLVELLLADKTKEVGELLQQQFEKFVQRCVEAKTPTAAGRISKDRFYD